MRQRYQPKAESQSMGLLPQLVLASLLCSVLYVLGVKNGITEVFAFLFVVVLPPIWGVTGFFRFQAGRGSPFDAFGILAGLIWLVVCLIFPLGFLMAFLVTMVLFWLGSWIIQSTASSVRQGYRNVRRNVDEADGVYNPDNYEE